MSRTHRTLISALTILLAAATPAAAQSADMTWHGGPIMEHVKVVAVLWGDVTLYTPEALTAYLTAVTAGPWMDVMAEYSTAGQHPGRGTFGGVFTDAAGPTNCQLTGSDIEAELAARIADQTLPAPDANTLYMLFLPKAVSVVDSGLGTSCVDYCAYHNFATVLHSPQKYQYALIPDCDPILGVGGHIVQGCFERENSAESVSHELGEAMTDPQVNAWYDENAGLNGGEIGDICASVPTEIVDGQPVVTLWSNGSQACLSTPAGGNEFSVTLPYYHGVHPGASTAFDVKVVGAAAGPIAMSVAGLPAGVTAAFDPPSVDAAGGTTHLTLSADASVNPQTVLFDVYGTASDITRYGEGWLGVGQLGAYTLGISAQQTTVAGQTATYTVTVTAGTGPPPKVRLQLNPAACMLGTFNPPVVAPGGTSTLTVTPSPSYTGGDLPFTVVGTADGSKFVLANALVTVTPLPGDFSVTATPATDDLAQGGSVTVSIDSADTRGPSTSIGLELGDLPDGVTGAFTKRPIASGSSTTLVFKATSTAATGPVHAVITGTGKDGTAHTTAVDLTVTASAAAERPDAAPFNGGGEDHPAGGCALAAGGRPVGAPALILIGLCGLGLAVCARRRGATW